MPLGQAERGQARAPVERIAANLGDTARKHELDIAGRVSECLIADPRDAVQFDLDALIAPALDSIAADDEAAENYALSITGPSGELMLTPKNPAPKDYVAPAAKTNDLTLRVYPANPKQ